MGFQGLESGKGPDSDRAQRNFWSDGNGLLCLWWRCETVMFAHTHPVVHSMWVHFNVCKVYSPNVSHKSKNNFWTNQGFNRKFKKKFYIFCPLVTRAVSLLGSGAHNHETWGRLLLPALPRVADGFARGSPKPLHGGSSHLFPLSPQLQGSWFRMSCLPASFPSCLACYLQG